MSMTIAERNETVAALEDVALEDVALEDVALEDVAMEKVALEDVERNGTAVALELEDEATDYLAVQGTGHDVPAQAQPIHLGEYPHAPDAADTADRPEGGPALAVFCYENPDSF